MNGKTVLITGSTAGIGLACAEAFAAQGYNLMLNGVESNDVGQELARYIRDTWQTGALFHGADVGNSDSIESMYDTAINEFGSIDVVINNAVVRYFGPIEKCDPHDWDRAISVNLSSAFHTTRLALPGMRKNSWGRIINMSSVFGSFAIKDRASYITTKTALLGLTRAIAMETVDVDITCNAISPGAVNTTRSQQQIETLIKSKGLSVQEAEAHFLNGRQPDNQFVDAHSVAAMALFLCGPASASINGASFPIDGGWTVSSGGQSS